MDTDVNNWNYKLVIFLDWTECFYSEISWKYFNRHRAIIQHAFNAHQPRFNQTFDLKQIVSIVSKYLFSECNKQCTEIRKQYCHCDLSYYNDGNTMSFAFRTPLVLLVCEIEITFTQWLHVTKTEMIFYFIFSKIYRL